LNALVSDIAIFVLKRDVKLQLTNSIERGSIQCTNRNRNLHISKIRFLFLVSFTIEYKVSIVEFYLYMGFGADLLKMWSPEPEHCWNRNPHTYKIGKLLPVCLTNRRLCDHISEPLAKFGENW